MSLTSLLRAPDVRQRFNTEFRKPKFPLSSDILAAPIDPSRAHASLVGMAFDYALRLHVTIVNEDNGNVWGGAWIAEEAVDKLANHLALRLSIFPPGATRSGRGLLSRAQRIVRDARDEYERCCDDRTISDAMLGHALLLAQLEQFYRCGLLSERFGEVSETGVRDLRNLIALAQRLKPETFAASRVCVLNPGFRAASQLVGGADADILIDDTLIEIKVVKHLKFTAEMFRQLLGYFMLYKIGGGLSAGPRPKPEIRKLAVYFARFGVLLSFPVESLVNAATFPTFIRWLKRRARNGPPREELIWTDGTVISY